MFWISNLGLSLTMTWFTHLAVVEWCVALVPDMTLNCLSCKLIESSLVSSLSQCHLVFRLGVSFSGHFPLMSSGD